MLSFRSVREVDVEWWVKNSTSSPVLGRRCKLKLNNPTRIAQEVERYIYIYCVCTCWWAYDGWNVMDSSVADSCASAASCAINKTSSWNRRKEAASKTFQSRDLMALIKCSKHSIQVLIIIIIPLDNDMESMRSQWCSRGVETHQINDNDDTKMCDLTKLFFCWRDWNEWNNAAQKTTEF